MLEPELVIFNEGSKNKFNEMLLIDLVIFFFFTLWGYLLESEIISSQPGVIDLQNGIGIAGGGSNDLEAGSLTF